MACNDSCSVVATRGNGLLGSSGELGLVSEECRLHKRIILQKDDWRVLDESLERERTPRTRVSWKSATVCMLFSGMAGRRIEEGDGRRKEGKGELTKPELCGRLYSVLGHGQLCVDSGGSADLGSVQLI